ncbi:MAG: histidine phosphatase family protein [Gammaproteobacteria bacterium]|nr:histidine phosphatase family protein [Gammaproteobacteria bacterium]
MTRWLAETPAEAPVTVLLRHSARGPLPDGDAANAVPLTTEGANLACHLGAMLGTRLQALHVSPLRRCVETAEALRFGAGINIPIVPDRSLGDPGIYVTDSGLAQANWEQLGHERVMRYLVSGTEPLPGMADPGPAARLLVRHMMASAGNRSGLHLFVTHDSVVTATAAHLLGEPFERDDWPWYLEGAFFWLQGTQTATAYRDFCRRVDEAL